MSTDMGDRAVGTVALKHEGNGTYELTKMAVEPDHRGAGIGRKLMEQALETYRAVNGRVLYLETNTRLRPAIALYESVGFRHRNVDERDTNVSRANVYMVWEAD